MGFEGGWRSSIAHILDKALPGIRSSKAERAWPLQTVGDLQMVEGTTCRGGLLALGRAVRGNEGRGIFPKDNEGNLN